MNPDSGIKTFCRFRRLITGQNMGVFSEAIVYDVLDNINALRG